MVKHKTKNEAFLPIKDESHIKEDDSNDIFRAVIKPWMFQSAIAREYGIDGIVEIMRAFSNDKDQIVTGKRFSVQLKSSNNINFDKQKISHTIPKVKINYWFNALEPVLLVLVDLTSKSCFFRWIDEELIQDLFKANPNWIAQKSVTIKFEKEKTINTKTLLEIEKYVLNWKRPLKTILTPGSYFKHSDEVKSFINLFVKKVQEHKISFLSKEIKELEESTTQSIYTIAVVGPNKAGKSTLINCLLQKNISPVGRFPTTGIPITIFPSNENRVTILFKDNSKIEGEVEESFLSKYIDKEQNPDNKKKVKIVSVKIVNSFLERGFAICDVPGLDDPDSEIRQITKTALYNVNAIIYLISGGSMASGDFSINKQVIEDLNELGGRMDRLFLVFNKIDMLSEEDMTKLKEYVNKTLEKYDLLKYLPTPPIYISSQNSFNNRIENQNTNDTVGELEKQIWEYLLGQNKTGLHKIIGSFGDCLKIIEKLRNIIGARTIDTDKRENLEKEIQLVSAEINELKELVYDNKKNVYTILQEFLQNTLVGILDYLKIHLYSIPISESLPQNQQITGWLENNAFKTISDFSSSLDQHIYKLQSTINRWISEKLEQVDIRINNPNNSILFRMPEINQISNHYYEKKLGSFGVFESFFERIERGIKNLSNAIENLFTSETKKRKMYIEDILSKANKGYSNLYNDCLTNLNQYLKDICESMEEKSIDRTRVYLGELSSQLKKLDQPISQNEKQNFEKFLEEIAKIENEIQSSLAHLQVYTDGIEKVK